MPRSVKYFGVEQGFSCFEQDESGQKSQCATKSLLLEKQNHLNHQTAYFGQCISRSTKSDPFVQSITNDDIPANNIRRELNRSILRNSIFQQWSSLASFNELLHFSESSLQATYGHLRVQASYRRFQIAVKTSSASFNKLLDFSGSTLQASYGHLLIQASYSQFDQLSKQRSNRLSNYQLFHANYGPVYASCSAERLLALQ